MSREAKELNLFRIYKLAEKCAKKLGLTVDKFVSKAIDEKHEKLKRTK